MVDKFASAQTGLSSPITGSVAITPSDSTDLAITTRGILVDVAGNVKVTFVDDTTDTVNLAASMWHGMRVKRVWATGTTATGIHGGV